MSRMYRKRPALFWAGLFVAILFWVFCITFTVTVISGQSTQTAKNNMSRETVTVYVDNVTADIADSSDKNERPTQPSTQKSTHNLDKYYMIDKAGNYVKGTLPYSDK